jgi:hypothetical protein
VKRKAGTWPRSTCITELSAQYIKEFCKFIVCKIPEHSVLL